MEDCFEERELVEECALLTVLVLVVRALSDRVARCTGLECSSKGLPLSNRGGTSPWCEAAAAEAVSWLRFESDVVAGLVCVCV